MKARKLPGWLLGITLAGGVVASGFAGDGPSPWPSASTSTQFGGAVPPAGTVSSVAPKTSAQTLPETPAAAPAVSGAATAESLPPGTHVSPWFYEIERLTQAGVDEGVVLAYVANSAGTFNLTADQIIYLKNLGVAPEVINAMIQHDQELISGERPITATAPPPPPPAVQAAWAASLSSATHATAPPAPAAAPSPAPANTQIVANDDSGPDWILVEPDDAPEQPASLGPVRAPYPVKLSDPILVLRLPSFTVPCW